MNIVLRRNELVNVPNFGGVHLWCEEHRRPSGEVAAGSVGTHVV
jgi:hypothetical protein